jgi:hypothetical protein
MYCKVLESSSTQFNLLITHTHIMDALDTLLDGTLDDLADLPEFKPFPPGAHRCTVIFIRKEINKHPSVEVGLKAIETVELANPTEDTPLTAGAEASVAYMLDNEIGQGQFKELMKAFAKEGENKKLSELMEDNRNAEVLVVTALRDNKDKTRKFMNIKQISLV